MFTPEDTGPQGQIGVRIRVRVYIQLNLLTHLCNLSCQLTKCCVLKHCIVYIWLTDVAIRTTRKVVMSLCKWSIYTLAGYFIIIAATNVD